jgi:hypothetical protein
MDDEEYNPRTFIVPSDPAPAAGPPSVKIGWVLVFLMMAFAIAGGYLLVQKHGLPLVIIRSGSNEQISKQLAQIETRLATLEKREAIRTHTAATKDPQPVPTKATDSASAAGSFHIQVLPSRGVTIRSMPSGRPPEVSWPNSAGGAGTTPADAPANGEIWQATADRLGDAVAELNTQRKEIAAARQGINQISARMERSRLTFSIRKKAGPTQVGPVQLELRNTDSKAQKYTMRLLVDDRWIELKDRASQEQIQFQLSGISDFVWLVVSEVRDDRVQGFLSVPKGASPAMSPSVR